MTSETAATVASRAGRRDIQRLAAVLAALAATSAGYYFGAQLGFELRFPDSPHSVLWPPNAILLAALMLMPARLWWWCLAAVLPAHIAISLPAGVPWPTVLGLYLTNTSQALLGAALFKRYVLHQAEQSAHKTAIAFIVCGVFTAPIVLSFADVAIAVWTRWTSNDYWQAWSLRFLSNAASAAIIVPPILAAADLYRRWQKPSPRRLAEACLLGLCVVGLGSFAGLAGASIARGLPLLVCAYLPLLLWSAMRFGQAGASWTLLGLATATMGNIRHWPGFAGQTEILMQQAIFLLISIPVLYLGALYSDLRRYVRQLDTAAERHDMATRAAAIGVWDWDPRTDDLFIHPHLKRLLGYHDEEIANSRDGWTRHYHPEDVEKVLQSARACVRGESATFEVEHRMMHRDGSTRWLLTRGAPMRSEADSSVKLVGTCIDVTERKRIEEEIRTLRHEVTHLTRVGMLGELSGALAHEINQPLAAILSNGQAAQRLLAHQPPDLGEVQEALQDIVDSTKRAGNVIHRLRDMLKKGEPQFRALDINMVVAEVLDLARSDLIAHQVKVVRRFGSPMPLVRGDRIQLQQVLLNFIMNACEAMSATAPNRRVLTVTTATGDNQSVEIGVLDTGVGISPGMQQHLFEAFTTTKKNGLGLGLSISRSIVSTHGGRQWAENRAEGGAAFHLSLPRAVHGARDRPGIHPAMNAGVPGGGANLI
ncbi:MAG TPA: ATP-binding protein [Dongiaceae bacterium]|nr:ATP-binding protein [Dongiaceae bacterium]